jgi:3-deoxy-D-manno-octulosonate 8-phosphate phosphatase (KDO 8-P phosphatase)
MVVTNKYGIKLFLSDVDGVMTDAGMYYTETGDELKKFNTHDGMGFQLLREAGVKTGIITSENTLIVQRRAEKLKVDHVYQSRIFGGKLEAARVICEQEGIELNEVAYIGDDINCFELLNSAGIKACPANAVKKIKGIPGILQMELKGGEGAVREFIDYLLDY